jgi:hypothetical protein
MGATVLLRHDLPDGTSHFDWMVQRAPGQGLITFRVQERIDLQSPQVFTCERLPDHREVYLEYEGPISGGRGRVERMEAGGAEILHLSRDRVRVRIELGGLRGEFLGVRRAGATWDFRRVV